MKEISTVKKHKTHLIVLAIIASLFLVANIVLITIASFGDKATGEKVVVFGEVKVNASIVQNGGLNLDSNSLMAGQETERTLSISVPSDSASCYVRMYLSFTINSIARDFVSLSIKDGTSSGSNYYSDSFGTGKDGKLYLNGAVATNSTIQVPLLLTVSSEFGNDSAEELSNKGYNLTLVVEVVQSDYEGYEAWQDNCPANWPVA